MGADVVLISLSLTIAPHRCGIDQSVRVVANHLAQIMKSLRLNQDCMILGGSPSTRLCTANLGLKVGSFGKNGIDLQFSLSGRFQFVAEMNVSREKIGYPDTNEALGSQDRFITRVRSGNNRRTA